jgi:hypothetical protein
MSWLKKKKFSVNRSHHTLDIYRVEAPVTVDVLERSQSGLPGLTHQGIRPIAAEWDLLLILIGWSD